MSEAKKREYKNFLENVIDWARKCLEVLRFQKAWQKGQVPEAEMAGPIRASDEEEKLVQEIFNPSSTFPTKKKSNSGFDIRSIQIDVYGPKKEEESKPSMASTGSEASSDQGESTEIAEPPSLAPPTEALISTDTPSEASPSEETTLLPGKSSEPTESPVPTPSANITEEKSISANPKPSPPEKVTSEKSHLLVIDDYEPLLNMLARSLKAAGYEPICAKDGVEGIVKLHEQAVDLIITDVQMPKLDGFDLSKMLNVREETRDIPVIFLTEVLDDKTRTVAKRLGAADTIIKPFTMDTLLESVKTVLLSHKAVAQEPELETLSTP